MSKLLLLDYFATGEGRTIAVISSSKKEDEQLFKELESLTNTTYFNVGAEIFDISVLLTDKRFINELNIIKEFCPVFYDQLVKYNGKFNHEFKFHYHFNLA